MSLSTIHKDNLKTFYLFSMPSGSRDSSLRVGTLDAEDCTSASVTQTTANFIANGNNYYPGLASQYSQANLCPTDCRPRPDQ